MNAALYLRCSTDNQDRSVAQQCQELEQYATANGLTVVAVYFDQGVSGTVAQRPGFQSLLEDAKFGAGWEDNGKGRQYRAPFDLVLVYDRSRWSRQEPEESLFFEMLLSRAGKMLMSPGQAHRPMDTIGLITRVLESDRAFEERKSLLTRLQRGRIYATQNGYYTKGKPPFGYRLRKVKDGKRTRNELEIDPDEAKVVQFIYDMKRYGYSLRDTAGALNEERYPGPRGKQWNPETIRQILSNPVYRGRLTFACEKWGANGPVEGKCPAIITTTD